jgi:hypothetical protein
MAAVDAAVASVLADPSVALPAEMLYGLAGYATCDLERMPNRAAAANLARLAGLLTCTAEPIHPGVAWRTTPMLLEPEDRADHPAGRFDLGVAHGAAGIMAVLARMCAAIPTSAAVREVLGSAVKGILGQRADGHGGTTVPPFVGYAAIGTARTAWCYGDLGVAAALLSAARYTGSADWESAAVSMARACAARSVTEMRTLGTGICHGAAGVAHLFNRMYQATGDAVLAGAAHRWFHLLLDLRIPGSGVGGFGAFRSGGDGRTRWWADPGLLDGAAGVGLTLLAATESLEPEWDRALAVSIPVAGEHDG